MNSLQQLNGFGNEQLIFTDDRPFSVTATTDGLPQTGISVAEDTSVGFSAFGVTITKITGADDATSDHITLTFDFSSATNPKINWPTAPNNVVFSEPTPGVFVASQIQFIEDYEFILNNTTVKLVDQVSFLYTVNASWPGTSYTQTFNALMTTTPETNLNGLALQIRDYVGHTLFDPIQINPSIIDNNNDSTYDLQLTSSLGATLSIGPGTPVGSINITGDKPTVDAVLDTVYYYPIPSGSNQTDTINYTLTVTNGTLGNYVSESGSFTNFVPAEVIATNFDNIVRNYTENTIENDLFDTGNTANNPSIIDYYTPRSLTLTFTAINTNCSIIKSTDAFDTYSNVLTYTGTDSQINTWLSDAVDPIYFIPGPGSFATENINWNIYNGPTLITSGSFVVAGSARTTALAQEGVYTNTSLVVNAETILFGLIDILLVGRGGFGGLASSTNAAYNLTGGNGGDGGIIEFADQNIFRVDPGYNPYVTGFIPGDLLEVNGPTGFLGHYSTVPGINNTFDIAIGGQGGRGGGSSSSPVAAYDGSSVSNSGAGGGGAFVFVSAPNPDLYGAGGGFNATFGRNQYNIQGTYLGSPIFNSTYSGGASGNYPTPAAGGTITHTSSITGSSVVYNTPGQTGEIWDGSTLTPKAPIFPPPGKVIYRIKQV